MTRSSALDGGKGAVAGSVSSARARLLPQVLKAIADAESSQVTERRVRISVRAA